MGETASASFEAERESDSFADEECVDEDARNSDRLPGRTGMNDADTEPTPENHVATDIFFCVPHLPHDGSNSTLAGEIGSDELF